MSLNMVYIHIYKDHLVHDALKIEMFIWEITIGKAFKLTLLQACKVDF